MAEETILIIQLRQLGDILLTTPVLRALKKAKPRARLTFLSAPMGRLILDDCPYLDEHFVYEDAWTWKEGLRLANTLRERRFDLVLDFMNNPRSAFYTWRSGATRRLAFKSARRLAYTQTVARPEAGRYIVDEKFDLLRAAGFAPLDQGLVLPWFESHTRPLMKLWGERPAFRTAPLVVTLSPTHRRVPRRWPLDRYAALADRLVKDWGAEVVWLHGPGEEDLVARARAMCTTDTVLAPKTSFREMAALIANTDLFIGNSNGPSHVAVADNICSLQLHGPTQARSWCPMTEKHRAVEAVQTRSMEEISVDAVWQALQAMAPAITAQATAARLRRPRLSWRS